MNAASASDGHSPPRLTASAQFQGACEDSAVLIALAVRQFPVGYIHRYSSMMIEEAKMMHPLLSEAWAGEGTREILRERRQDTLVHEATRRRTAVHCAQPSVRWFRQTLSVEVCPCNQTT
ncbi:MAG: hypothetical protein QN163_04675 [Armatimonadota bacterium]|nr:hypothetical protein [Armatimonadota bacterium]